MAFLTPAGQFVSAIPGAEDFHLKDTSAAVDAGKNLAAAPASVNGIARTVDAPATHPDLLDIDGMGHEMPSAEDFARGLSLLLGAPVG